LEELKKNAELEGCARCASAHGNSYKEFENGYIKSKDLACWDTWMETIYEAFPQAILQIVFLLLRTEPIEGFWGEIGAYIKNIYNLRLRFPFKFFRLVSDFHNFCIRDWTHDSPKKCHVGLGQAVLRFS